MPKEKKARKAGRLSRHGRVERQIYDPLGMYMQCYRYNNSIEQLLLSEPDFEQPAINSRGELFWPAFYSGLILNQWFLSGIVITGGAYSGTDFHSSTGTVICGGSFSGVRFPASSVVVTGGHFFDLRNGTLATPLYYPLLTLPTHCYANFLNEFTFHSTGMIWKKNAINCLDLWWTHFICYYLPKMASIYVTHFLPLYYIERELQHLRQKVLRLEAENQELLRRLEEVGDKIKLFDWVFVLLSRVHGSFKFLLSIPFLLGVTWVWWCNFVLGNFAQALATFDLAFILTDRRPRDSPLTGSLAVLSLTIDKPIMERLPFQFGFRRR